MMQAQQEANDQIMRTMVEKMVASCFKKCAGTSVSVAIFVGYHRIGTFLPLALNQPPTILPVQGDKLDSREQSCMASCQDRYLDTRAQVQEALQKRQGMS